MADNVSTRPEQQDATAPSTHGARSDAGADAEATGAAVTDAPGDDASSVDHIQEKPGPQPTKKEKLKRHFRRFWWAYLIGLIIFLAILLPILFEVIIPAIVQNIVNGQSLPVLGGALRGVSPTHLNFSLTTELDTPLAVTIDPVDLQLSQPDIPDFTTFVQLTLPKQNVHHETNATITNQTVPVANQTELIGWFNDYFDNETVKVDVKGDLKVHLGELTYDPNLHKTIEIAGLNYLEGFGVEEMEFLLPPDERGYNIRGTLNLPNSGALDLYLGNVSFNMLSGDVNLGLVHLYELDMKRGNNTPSFEGQFYFNELVPHLGAILDEQSAALGRGVIELHAQGNTTFINGEHIPYVEGVLNRKRIPMEIGVVTLLGDVVNGLLQSEGLTLNGFLGETFGNVTLLEQLLGNWDGTSNSTSSGGGEGEAEKKKKRKVSGKRSNFYNMLRLGLMTRRSK